MWFIGTKSSKDSTSQFGPAIISSTQESQLANDCRIGQDNSNYMITAIMIQSFSPGSKTATYLLPQPKYS